ncbi:MAG: OmpA family protein, partial [Granulosicoccus sp.]|nr:OmpA family protein [Granulosicoccus sp.]
AEEARLQAEAEAAEAARLQAEAEAAEEARLQAEAEAAEEARLQAEAEAAEEARLQAEVEAEEQKRLASAALAADNNEADLKVAIADTDVTDRAKQAAAAEASRIAALARQMREYERVRDRELKILSGLSLRLRFLPGSATISKATQRALDGMFDLLYLYSDVPILVSLATNESDGSAADNVLSRDRGRAIASYLIQRGLEKKRFRIRIESGNDLPEGTHRVRVSAEDISQ